MTPDDDETESRETVVEGKPLPVASDSVETDVENKALRVRPDSIHLMETAPGRRLATKLAALSGSFSDAPPETVVDALPAGAREVSIREVVRDRQASEDLERIRDLVMPEDLNSLETLRQGALPPVDINATIVTKHDAQPAQRSHDHTLDVRHDMDQLETLRQPSGSELPRPVDVNATIVTQRARTVAEQERDLAFEKLRDGTADELRSAPKAHAEASAEPRKRHTTADGLPLLKTNAVEIRGARTRPDEDSGVTTRATGNAMGGTINFRGHEDGPALDSSEQALVGRLRALPPEGREPDWIALEASIRAEVHDQPGHRPWWKRWHYLVPLGALAATAGIALVLSTAPREAGTSEQALREPASREPAPTVWLDGEAFDLDAIDPTTLDQIVPDPATEVGHGGDDRDPSTGASSDDGILPAVDHGWLDTLDDEALARAESWLARMQP